MNGYDVYLDGLNITDLPEHLTDPHMKPKILDGEMIYSNDTLREILLDQGPDYFVAHLIDYFEIVQNF